MPKFKKVFSVALLSAITCFAFNVVTACVFIYRAPLRAQTAVTGFLQPSKVDEGKDCTVVGTRGIMPDAADMSSFWPSNLARILGGNDKLVNRPRQIKN